MLKRNSGGEWEAGRRDDGWLVQALIVLLPFNQPDVLTPVGEPLQGA